MYKTVYHVGDLSKKRQKPYLSYEGNMLSVSIHPNEWARIIKRGGNVYKLTNQNAKWFVNNKNTTKKALKWAKENKYIKSAVVYTLSWYDDEANEWVTQSFNNEDNAKAERDYYLDDREDEKEIILNKDTKGYVLDTQGIVWWKRTFSSDPKIATLQLIENFAPLWFAEAHGYDGVWWNENLDVLKLSAPRGGIFQYMLPRWSIKLVGYI